MKTFPASVLAAMTFLCFYGNASGRFASRRRASTVRRPTGSIDSGSSTSCSQGTCGDRVLLDSTVLDTSKVNMTALVNTTRVVICTGVTCALPTSAGCYRQYLFNSTLFDSTGDIPTNNTAGLTSEKVHVCSSHPWRATSGVPKTRNSIGKIGWIIAGAVVGAVIIVACGCIFCSKKKK